MLASVTSIGHCERHVDVVDFSYSMPLVYLLCLFCQAPWITLGDTLTADSVRRMPSRRAAADQRMLYLPEGGG
jgi:hypothetical protein